MTARPSKSDVQRAAVEATIRAHKSADRVRISGVRIMKSAFDDEVAAIHSGLRSVLHKNMLKHAIGGTREKMRQVLEDRVPVFGRSVGDGFVGAVRSVAIESVAASSKFLHHVRKSASPVDDPRIASAVLRRNMAPILELRELIAKKVTSACDLASQRIVLAAADATPSAMLSSVDDVFEGEWWQFERFARTEVSKSYNSVQMDALLENAKEIPGLWGRWTELIDDLTSMPFDNRVAQDSFVLHGQVTHPGGVFTMPPDIRVKVAVRGMSWPHPPNRPNDRAVLVPWMPHWGIPGWIWQSGQRIQTE